MNEAVVGAGGDLCADKPAADEPDRAPVAGIAEHERTHCANCDTGLVGHWCHGCGQKAQVHRTLHDYAHDALHGILHLDGKLFHTLPMLLLRPGLLTHDYAHGRRARHLSPLALFLFAVFLMFALVRVEPTATGGEVTTGIKTEAGRELAEATRDLKAAEARAAADPSAANARRLEETRDAVAFARTAAGQPTADDKARIERFQTGILTKSGFSARIMPLIGKLRANPELFFFKVQSKAYKFAWALIPLSLPFMWLLFPRRRDLSFYDHAVFVTYSLAFAMLLVATGSLLGWLGAGAVAPWLVLAIPLHMYAQLKGAYRLSRAGGLARTVLLLLFAILVLSTFALGLTLAGLVG